MGYFKTNGAVLQLTNERVCMAGDTGNGAEAQAGSIPKLIRPKESYGRNFSFGALKSALLEKLRVPDHQYASARLDGIESLRAYAALSIILFHMAAIGLVNIPDSIAFIKSHFGFGVPLFFVVSGFCMAYGYWGKLDSREALSSYFVRRFTRIAPLFYFMLVFQLLHLWAVHDLTMRPWEVFVNVVFIFNLIPHLTDGIVPASWSIGVEMLFYAIFPVAILFAITLWRALFMLLCTILMATHFTVDMRPYAEALPSFIHHNFLTNFPYFAWGILGYHVFRFVSSKLGEYVRRLVSWGLCGGGILLMYVLYTSSALYMYFWNLGFRTTWDTLWGGAFALLCIGLAIHPTRVLSNLFTRYMGRISFSLYLVHPTVIYYLWKSGTYGYINNASTDVVWVGFCISMAITVAVIAMISYFTYQYIEVPGMALGQRLVKKSPAAVTSVSTVEKQVESVQRSGAPISESPVVSSQQSATPSHFVAGVGTQQYR